MRCRVVTPDKTYYDGDASRVIVPAWDGEMGFLNGHAPLIAKLGYGVLRVEQPSNPTMIRIAIFGGFVKVRDNEVVVLAGGAEAAADINHDAAQARVERARKESREKVPPRASAIEAEIAAEERRRAEVLFAAVAETISPILV